MSHTDPGPEATPSRSADAAAIRWSEAHPDDDAVQHMPPPSLPDADGIVPNRHSASAEAAALRWLEEHPAEDA
jgi:hypothetical protein